MFVAKAVIALIGLHTATAALPTEDCPILGPVLPFDFDITSTDAFAQATASFPTVIEKLFDSGAINKTNSTFTIDIYPAVTNSSVFQYHNDASNLHAGLTAGTLNDSTIFRVGSVSKLFTAYAILAHSGFDVLNAPVTKYLPELAGNAEKNPLRAIVWEQVTVGALMSHQAGAGGFAYDQATCILNNSCSVTAFLDEMRDNKRPTTPVYQTPIYADSGFGVLGRVLERLTNSTYNEAIQQGLAQPLNMYASSFEPTGNGVNGMIMPGSVAESSWGWDNQVTAPSGGIYASNKDLRTLGLSILHSQLLSPADTRRWFKPHGDTASLASPVGAPWEIARLPLPVTSNSSRYRICDVYTKVGGQAGYGTIFGLSPDHKLGFSINVASYTSAQDRWTLREAVGEVFLTAAEAAAAEYAAKNYAGTFVADALPGTNATLTIEDNKPGLGLKSLYFNGTEVRTLLLGGIAEPLNIPAQNVSVRLYPTGLEDGSMRLHRAIIEILPGRSRASIEGGSGLFDRGCETWQDAAFFPDLDSFILDFQDGKLQSLTSVSLNTTMKRSI